MKNFEIYIWDHQDKIWCYQTSYESYTKAHARKQELQREGYRVKIKIN